MERKKNTVTAEWVVFQLKKPDADPRLIDSWANRMPPHREDVILSDEVHVWTDCVWLDREDGTVELESGYHITPGMAWMAFPEPHTGG
ncbi:MAG: hypothetical protein MJ074_07485 [Oscillospiraceae bacterium]|nr:hypothetical protein [Oscillospiraceae bacterium]